MEPPFPKGIGFLIELSLTETSGKPIKTISELARLSAPTIMISRGQSDRIRIRHYSRLWP